MATLSNDTALNSLLSKLLQEYVDRTNNSASSQAGKHSDNLEIIYVILLLGFFGFCTFGIMLSNIRSKKLEHSNDPYNIYIETDIWHKLDEANFHARIVESYKSCCVFENQLAVEQPINQIPQVKSS
ncbi:transcription factor SOX-9 [Platysternon megacephalum]|uniref:Potassium voltage-gated channel subfamily E member 1 n=1 Tax=Platysternon megacephalum TaxID=55544 RepID=A0A4D9EKR9_9SAUR|nr:transcription factor SOX-9 [Platysternon megacephalum]